MHLIVEHAPAVHADRPPWLARTPRLRTTIQLSSSGRFPAQMSMYCENAM